jgi:hypothetical protein
MDWSWAASPGTYPASMAAQGRRFHAGQGGHFVQRTAAGLAGFLDTAAEETTT